MPMKKSFDEAYAKACELDKVLPKEWNSLYEVTACLKESTDKRTYLVKSKEDESKYILKTARGKEAEYLLQESKIMQELGGGKEESGETGLCGKDTLSADGVAYLLRNYVTGVSLAQKLEKYSYSDAELVAVGLDLCREVRKLHHRKPPVIHRDIKPENIIIKPDGTLMLIDLETARTYKEGQREDTRFMGSRETAAPEQFGFGQSDERTDIYGIGRTLLYAKTDGDIPDDLKKLPGDRRINNVIKKCCSFDPKRRFPNIELLIRALEKCLPSRKRYYNAIGALCAVIVLLLIVSASLFRQMNYAETVSVQTPSVANAPAQTTDYSERIILSGWDVTEYDGVVAKIVESCNEQDYDQLAEQCEQLLDMLYADEKLTAVDAIDTYEYAEDDSRWEEYKAVRLGYENAADLLAYHDGMLKKEMDNLEVYRYYIYKALRNNLEHTEVDGGGNILHSLLYEYTREGSQVKKRSFDYCIVDVLHGMIESINNYHNENR